MENILNFCTRIELEVGLYTLQVGFTIVNNLIRDRGLDCNCIINGRVEFFVEYTLRRLRSKILYFIRRHGEKREK